MKITASNGTARFEHNGKVFVITFHRTLRLPEDGKTHALPPSLGTFPVKLVDDYKDKVPFAWREHGGVFIPLHQREAMWLGFSGFTAAVKVATGKVNAVNGQPWQQELVAGVEDYMVAPSPQCWLDGFNAGTGVIKQFVAMPMGMGYTVEHQVTGKEEFGGLQLLVMPAHPGRIREPKSILRSTGIGGSSVGSHQDDMLGAMTYSSHSMEPQGMLRGMSVNCSTAEIKTGGRLLQAAEMGLAAGGTMTQKIYPDPHGLDVWDQAAAGRLYVHIVNAEMYAQITGEQPPAMPVSAQSYQGPWYGLDDSGASNIAAPEVFQGLKTVGQKDQQHGFVGQQDDAPVDESGKVVTYSHTTKTVVRDGTW
jgi:hypothetical protein